MRVPVIWYWEAVCCFFNEAKGGWRAWIVVKPVEAESQLHTRLGDSLPDLALRTGNDLSVRLK